MMDEDVKIIFEDTLITGQETKRVGIDPNTERDRNEFDQIQEDNN